MAEKKINGRTVQYKRLPADQGLQMLLRVLKVLGPAGGMIEAIAAEDEGQRDVLAMASIMSFVQHMDDKAVYDLIMDMAKNCSVDGVAVTDATVGVMDLQELLSTAMFALQTEFGGFFADGAGSVLLKARPAA